MKFPLSQTPRGLKRNRVAYNSISLQSKLAGKFSGAEGKKAGLGEENKT